MAAIADVFNDGGPGFVLLPAGQKFPPRYKGWQKPENARTFKQACDHTGNVGILAGNGFVGLDKDDPAAFDGLALPASITWETRLGRLGVRYKVSDDVPAALENIGKKTDQAQLYLSKNGKHCGEIKLQRSYQVIPPSWKTLEDGSRADYKLLSEHPLATITLSGLLADLHEAGITISATEKPEPSRLESNVAKLESNGREARKQKAETAEARTRRYAEAALADEALTLSSTPTGSRNEALNKAAFALGQFVSAGLLSEAEVERELSRAAINAGLERDEIARTMKSGLESGARHPREIPGPDEAHLRKDGQKSEGEEEGPEVSEGTRAEALDILQHGDPIKCIVDQCGKMVLGAEKAFRKLVCCVAVQGVKQSAGLHPKLSGESGAGKTAAIYAFSHLLPAEAVVKGSSSNLAAFYHSDGNSVFRILDDYQAGNETLDTIIKQTTSVFHQPYDHRTVKKQEALTLHIGSEQTWAVTSVDSSQDIQVLNRQIPINVDDSEELTRKVNARTIERYGKGEEQFPEGDAVLVCREIWRTLRGGGLIDVRVPYFERIEWLDTSNRRNPSIFMDLLVAHTAMFRYQREQDPEGYFLSTEADFEAAKALFTDKDAQELVYRLTKAEREFADLLTKHPEGLTRAEAADGLHKSETRISQLANGEKGKGGLTQKLPGFSIVEITDSERLDEDHHRSTKKVLYRLTKYDPLTGFEAVVRLRPENDDCGDSKDGKEPVSLPVRKPENKENDNRERENREIEIGSKESKEKVREAGSDPLGSPKPSLSLLNPEKSLLREKSMASGPDAILTESNTNPYRPYSMATDIERKSLLAEGDEEPQQAGKDTTSEKIRTAALMEFGIAGWVDPAKLALALRLPPDEVEAWLRANYTAVDRPGGGVGYRQRRMGEAQA